MLWRPTGRADGALPDPSQVELVEVGGQGASIPLVVIDPEQAELELELGAPLTPGATYRLADRTICEALGGASPAVVFEAVEPAPLPGPSDSLGSLRVIPEGIGSLSVATGIGSCASEVEADRVIVELEPSEAVRPWLGVLELETRVDGERWHRTAGLDLLPPVGESWIGRGRDRIYIACASEDSTVIGSGAAEGAHLVAMRARLPGTRVPLVTAEVEITLSCGDAPEPPGDGGAGEGEASDDEDGGCAAGGRSDVPGVAAAALLLAIVGSRRRLPGRAGQSPTRTNGAQ